MAPTEHIGVLLLALLPIISAGGMYDFTKMRVLVEGPSCKMSQAPHQEGIVFRLDKYGTVVMLDEKMAAYVVKGGYRSTATTVATIDVTQGSVPQLTARQVMFTNMLPKENGIAMLKRLINKKLPYSYYGCNEVHYMNYCLGGDPHTGPRIPLECLLARPLDGVPVAEIESDEFALQNKVGDKVRVASLEDFK